VLVVVGIDVFLASFFEHCVFLRFEISEMSRTLFFFVCVPHRNSRV
jgi:hypothetical protein